MKELVFTSIRSAFVPAAISMILATFIAPTAADTLKLEMLPNEYWWGGLSSVGQQTPYDAASVANHDLDGDNKGNQAQPLLLSSNLQRLPYIVKM